MDKSGVASPTTILTLIEETAADHCHSINFSLYDLEALNIGWVLVSGYLQMERYPAYKETIIIRTWLSNYSLVKGYRENIIYDEHFNIIGKARGIWVFFDIKKRRPAQIFEDIKEKWSYCNQEAIDHDIGKKIEAIDKAGYLQEYIIKRFDTDSNKHVNNVRYLQWVIESIPEDVDTNYYLHTIDGRFIGEAQYGDIIISLTNEGIADKTFAHTIKVKGDNKVCATAQTSWKPKF